MTIRSKRIEFFLLRVDNWRRGGREGKKRCLVVRAIDSLGLLLYIIYIYVFAKKEDPRVVSVSLSPMKAPPRPPSLFPSFQFVVQLRRFELSTLVRNVKNLKSIGRRKSRSSPPFNFFPRLDENQFDPGSKVPSRRILENLLFSFDPEGFENRTLILEVYRENLFSSRLMLSSIRLDRFGEEGLGKSGGPQGRRVFLSRQYLSSLCPVVKPASLLFSCSGW